MQGHEPAPTPSAAEAQPRDMFTDRQIRMLKLAVIGMGAILLAGFALVIGRIIYLVNKPPPQAEATAPAAMSQSASGLTGNIAPPALALPAGAAVRHLAISETHLAVHFDAPAGSGLKLFDLRNGTWSKTITIIDEKNNNSNR